jgi:hypothetical protein
MRALGVRRGVLCKKSLGDLTEGARSLFDQWSVEVECWLFAWTVPKNRKSVGSARNHLKRESSPSPVKGLSDLSLLRTGVKRFRITNMTPLL